MANKREQDKLLNNQESFDSFFNNTIGIYNLNCNKLLMLLFNGFIELYKTKYMNLKYGEFWYYKYIRKWRGILLLYIVLHYITYVSTFTESDSLVCLIASMYIYNYRSEGPGFDAQVGLSIDIEFSCQEIFSSSRNREVGGISSSYLEKFALPSVLWLISRWL